MGYDRVYFVLANIPPHKELAQGASTEQRLDMLQLAIKDDPRFQAETCEIQRGGISYTYDTLRFLENRDRDIVDGKFGLIMGDDLIEGFESWHNYSQLPEVADIIVAHRMIQGNAGTKEILFHYKHTRLANSVLPVSSSGIRDNIKTDKNTDKGSWRYLVPKEIYQYIIQRQLYGYGNT